MGHDPIFNFRADLDQWHFQEIDLLSFCDTVFFKICVESSEDDSLISM